MTATERTREGAKRETREALIHAGLAEFSERGLDTPSLDAICARAGYTRGAFYVHFRNREDFIVAVMESVLGGFLDAIIAGGGGSARPAEASDGETSGDPDAIADSARAGGPGQRGSGDTGAAGGADLEETVFRFARALIQGNPLTGERGSMRTHHLLDVCSRSETIRARFLAMLAEADRRLADAASAGQHAGGIRSDVPAESLAAVLSALAMGIVQLFELGAPVAVEDIRAAVLRLLAPA